MLGVDAGPIVAGEMSGLVLGRRRGAVRCDANKAMRQTFFAIDLDATISAPIFFVRPKLAAIAITGNCGLEKAPRLAIRRAAAPKSSASERVTMMQPAAVVSVTPPPGRHGSLTACD